MPEGNTARSKEYRKKIDRNFKFQIQLSCFSRANEKSTPFLDFQSQYADAYLWRKSVRVSAPPRKRKYKLYKVFKKQEDMRHRLYQLR